MPSCWNTFLARVDIEGRARNPFHQGAQRDELISLYKKRDRREHAAFSSKPPIPVAVPPRCGRILILQIQILSESGVVHHNCRTVMSSFRSARTPAYSISTGLSDFALFPKAALRRLVVATTFVRRCNRKIVSGRHGLAARLQVREP